MIQIKFNRLGMVFLTCSHVQGYTGGRNAKGKSICNKCARKYANRIETLLKEKTK